MKLNKTLALALHRAMWTDMQTSLGDNPSAEERKNFKYEWVKRFFPDEHVANSCFLCEFADAVWAGSQECQQCPISWPEKDCCHPRFSYSTAPISAILALPERDKELTDLEAKYTADDQAAAAEWYYKYRESLLSKASGLPAHAAIGAHVKAIQKKAVQQSTFSKLYGDTKMELAKASGHPAADGTIAHIKAIKEKAVEEYFEKNPGAKLATMDVDQAFKQYADEQKAPIFQALAEASGLPADESVKAHISKIEEKANRNSALAETYRKSMLFLRDTLNIYRDYLSDESGLDRNRPVDDHIMQIYDYGFSDGKRHERERIMNKIGEMLNDKSARTEKDS